MKMVFAGSLFRRLQIYLILFMLIPLILSGFVFYWVSLTNLRNLALQSSAQVVDKTAADVDSVLFDMIKLPSLISADNTIQNIMEYDGGDPGRLASDIQRGDAKLSDFNEYQQDIYGIYVQMDNGIALKSRYFEWENANFVNGEFYQSIHNNTYRFWRNLGNGSMMVNAGGEPVLSLYSQLIDVVSERTSGVVVVETQLLLLEKKLNSDMGKDGAMFLVTDQNELIACSSGLQNSESVASYLSVLQNTAIGKDAVYLTQGNKVLICQRLPKSGWIVVGVVSNDYLQKNARSIMLAIIVIAALCIVAAFLCAKAATRYELAPIRQMIDGMARVEDGDFATRLPVIRDDEIGSLTANFNDMTNRLGDLVNRISEEQKNLRRAEFKALQAQIAPHFLYNTLDSINGLTRMGKQDEVVQMVRALTVFFKTSLSSGRDIISIQEEVQHTESYLTIQKMRYNSLFDYRIHIETGVEKFMVPKLILQPLVENALYHGIKPSGRRCMLLIDIIRDDDNILLEVVDNGAGMDTDTLQKLRLSLDGWQEETRSHFGVQNVNNRIKTLMGQEYGLQYQSEPGAGTVVTIRIKCSQEGTLDV